MSFRPVAAALFALLTLPATAFSQQSADRAAVHRAVLDYVEGFYEGDSTKLVRSVRPDVVKQGFYAPGSAPSYEESTMPWSEFLSYVRNVRTRKAFAPKDAPKEIAIYDVLDRTASAKLTAAWGTDYLLLAKDGDRWMIRMVLWQSPPRKT
ncbi:MAG: nuclear transport factor 2 family protein [Gemmatimonadales bacterium]